MGKLIYEQETFKIIGAAMTVHKSMGAGFLESVYHEAFEMEMRKQQIPFETHKKFMVYYRGTALKKYFIADFICYDKIVVEFKSAAFSTKVVKIKQ